MDNQHDAPEERIALAGQKGFDSPQRVKLVSGAPPGPQQLGVVQLREVDGSLCVATACKLGYESMAYRREPTHCEAALLESL